MRTKRKDKASFLKFSKILIILLSGLGLAISLYLTYIHFANTKSFCDLSETISCDVVTTSIFSEVFGIPLSILGVGYFGVVLTLVLLKKSSGIFKIYFYLTLFTLIPSLYLTGVEAFILNAFCPLCESSKVLMFGILILSFLKIRKESKIILRNAVPIIITGLVAVGVTYFAQTGSATSKDYSTFVDSLNKKGVVYYKSVKCSNCKREEKLFGKAYVKLNSVECHPEGKDPKPELCLKMGIKKTPTFLIEQDGRELKRLEGLQKLDKIGQWAGVPFEK